MGHFAVTSSSCDDQLEKSLIAGSVCKNIDDSSDDDIDKLKKQNRSNGVIEIKSMSGGLPAYVPQDKTNIDEYTENFKGDNVFGIQFKAPLKWDKVIQISSLHIVFLYAFAVYPLERLNIWTTLFGKFFEFIFTFVLFIIF